MSTVKSYQPWLAAMVCSALAGLLSCGGGGTGVASLEAGRHDTAADVSRSTGVLIQESEIATLPDWQRAKFNDSGWNQPYIPPLASDAVIEPSGELLLEFARQLRDRGAEIVPRGVNVRRASWLAEDPPAGVIQGEYESVGPAETPPFGCNSDPVNEHNGHALEDVIVQEAIELPEVYSFVSNGLTEPNWFNRSGGTGNDARSAVYQLFAKTTGLEPGEPAQYGELCYRADLAPGVGPGGSCGVAQAYLVSGLIWKRFNSAIYALPNLEERYNFDILIAPASAETGGLTSSGNTLGRYQEFYCGDLSSCFGGGWIVGVESSASGCEAFDTQIAAAYEQGDPFYFSPVYGVLLKRWQQQQLSGMAGPWEGELGWPVLGPVPCDNGALQMSRQGSYYVWGMWFERGFMAWLDYDQEAYPETPDQVQVFSFSGSNVFCPATGHYQRIKPDYRYGSTAPWPSPQGQPRVAVTVNGCRHGSEDYWIPAQQSMTGEYQIGLSQGSPYGTVELSLTAQAWGGTPNPGCTYDYYIWAFRDGTIYMGNEAEAKSVTHTYGSETRNLEGTYVVRVQVSDSTGAVTYGDSYPITFGHGGAAGSKAGPFNEYDGPPEIIQVNIGTWHDGAYDFGNASLTWDGATGDYPDQSMANPYLTSDPFAGDYIVTTSRNNDWKNGNDIDFSFPWYAYIVDVNGDGVQTGAGNNADDTVFFGGLLLDDPGMAWARDESLNYYGAEPAPDNGVPSVVIDGFDPPVVVAGYYVSTTGDAGGEVRAGYGMAPASTTIDNANKVTAECIAHWPQTIRYGGVFLPGGYLQSSDPRLIWSMYPGHNLPVPDEYNFTGVGKLEATPLGWDSYRWMFDVDPGVTVDAREDAADWNKPVFPTTDRYTEGRVVYFDYSTIPHWNPDLNRDGDDNSLGINDTGDKFPVRVRLITEYSDYVLWDGTWPDHLPDPGIDPAEGGPIWYDDEQDPPMYYADWPDYLEGGAYVVDTGAPVYPLAVRPSRFADPPHLCVSGNTGDYEITFNYRIEYGTPQYTMDFNIGFEYTTADPLTSFGTRGISYYGMTTHSSAGENSYSVAGIAAPGEFPESTDLYVAARVTDQSVPTQQAVWIWRVPVRFEPTD